MGLGSSRFARRYSGNLVLISFPPPTEMFQFSGLASSPLCIQSGMTRFSPCRVPPFGHLRLIVYSDSPKLFAGNTSFFACQCQGIHQQPLKAWPKIVSQATPLWSLYSQAPFFQSDTYSISYPINCILYAINSITWVLHTENIIDTRMWFQDFQYWLYQQCKSSDEGDMYNL